MIQLTTPRKMPDPNSQRRAFIRGGRSCGGTVPSSRGAAPGGATLGSEPHVASQGVTRRGAQAPRGACSVSAAVNDIGHAAVQQLESMAEELASAVGVDGDALSAMDEVRLPRCCDGLVRYSPWK